jgi:hypothetical protein
VNVLLAQAAQQFSLSLADVTEEQWNKVVKQSDSKVTRRSCGPTSVSVAGSRRSLRGSLRWIRPKVAIRKAIVQ